ncbi:retrovirus-related Pol polyprotein from transposon 412 [Trichonephila clavata]|uniref:Retrovirus-related Pol polyprotein from transposon 412 n=1 Tax=Trichonephila clavata TaxID=2740835 RepID=A0A8X6GVJ6_TRICU|nr:retrovirus-related Pol polyprotein from transposon 412 [Trichonephila clavata]
MLIDEYEELFSCTSGDLGRTKLAQHRIETGNHSPIKQNPRRLPIAKATEVKDLLRDMQERDVIEPSSSPWASPIVRFVKGFSSIVRPLHRLTENKQKFLWTDECEEAFNSLKAALTSSPILVYPDPEKQFILDTDASHESVGAVLSQEINGQEHVIAYWSKCLSKPERNYCVTRKELLAIVKAVENFHSYLYGWKFLLRTDHASLTWLLNFKNTEGQIARWIQKLEEYDFEIKHRKRSLHGMELRPHRDHPIYEVPDRGRMKLDSSRSWRESGDGDSSSESDNEDILYTLHSPEDRIIRDEARESETECDRLWKTFEANQYEGNKRWAGDHAVLA